MSQQGAAGGDRTRDGLDHLQAAALEAIAAARAFLDVAEELVREPGAVADALRAVAGAAAASARAAETGAGGTAAAGPDAGAAEAAGQPGGDADARSGALRRIPLA